MRMGEGELDGGGLVTLAEGVWRGVGGGGVGRVEAEYAGVSDTGNIVDEYARRCFGEGDAGAKVADGVGGDACGRWCNE